ncbi:MerR family transcriptional regulator [Aquirufa echingensis]|jgi:DNA-binding transcriptional MerR regulator|uniref:MerR family transcriptional regulator n=1 Tax=Aquirufa echingensis TaxID=3096516 RepID=A0ABW6D2M1_9BACT
MAIYSIKDLENLSGIKAHTLRIWEQRYGILNPIRTETNIRTYSDEELKRVLNIALLQDKGGFKISAIANMSEAEMASHILHLSESQFDFPDQIQALTLAMMDLDEAKFQLLTKNMIQAHGFESYMLDVIYPFMRRLGTLWLSGSVGPAQEHFISHLIRQKLVASIDAQDLSLKPDAKKFLLYLPEGELHEIGLLFANYVFRARKHSVVYLGQSLPYEELLLAYEIHQPDYIFSVFTSEPNVELIDNYVAQMAKDLPNAQVLLTGYQILQPERQIPSNIHVIPDFQGLIDLANA